MTNYQARYTNATIQLKRDFPGTTGILVITALNDEGNRVHVETFRAYGMRDARKTAVARGATPWNF